MPKMMCSVATCKSNSKKANETEKNKYPSLGDNI